MGLFDGLFAKSRTVVLHVSSANGFHLRPAAVFTTEAKKFASRIEAETRGKSVDAKNLNALLSLGLEHGDHFDLVCKGKDAEAAIEALTRTFETLMEKESATPEPLKQESTAYTAQTIPGETIASGIVVAPLWRYHAKTVQETPHPFSVAVETVLQDLSHADTKEKEIALAQKTLLETLLESVNSLEAMRETVEEACQTLQGSAMEAKCTDYRDLLRRIESAMGYHTVVDYPATPFILEADDLLPSEVETLPSACRGVILHHTSPASHTAILLRAEGIPTLIATDVIPPSDTPIILDASAGVLVPSPVPSDMTQAQKREETIRKRTDHAHAKRFEPARTTDGKIIKVLANVTDPTSAKEAKEAGAEGIGLLRTEFLFGEVKPDYHTQKKTYRAIFELFDEVTVRTLDAGGDKALPYIDLPEESNPFLGIRGVRLFKSHPDIMEEQLHAIFDAAEGKAVKVMFPMVATPEEFITAKRFAVEVAEKYSCSIDNIAFGMMVEVPSVLFLMEAFNQEVDFYSIGSNDLNQYLHAVERTHPTLSLDPRSEALFAAIAHCVRHAQKPVSICGELAADEAAIERLVTCGVTTLSVSAKAVANTKERIRHV